MTLTIPEGTGYYDLTDFPWGGDFRRATIDMPVEIIGVIDQYTNGTPRRIIVRTSNGRKLGIERAELLATGYNKLPKRQTCPDCGNPPEEPCDCSY